MKTPTPAETVADLKEKARDILERLKEATEDNVIDPAVGTVRRAARSTNEWVTHHTYPTAGIAFLAGIVLGAVLGRELR